MKDVGKKEKAPVDVDMESVEINKRSVRLFGEVFSADEELQVFSKIVKYSTFYLCVLSKSSMLYLCVLHFICCWGLLSKHFDILQTKALKSYYEKAGLSAEKKLEVLKVCQTLGIDITQNKQIGNEMF